MHKENTNLLAEESDQFTNAENILEASKQKADDVINKMGVSLHGCSQAEAANRLERFAIQTVTPFVDRGSATLLIWYKNAVANQNTFERSFVWKMAAYQDFDFEKEVRNASYYWILLSSKKC